jgi:cell division protein FtsB
MSTPPMMPEAALPREPAQQALSEPARLIKTFTAPSETFADVKRRGGWWAPWLLVAIVAIVSLVFAGQKIGYETVARQSIERSSRAQQFDNLPAEQQERQLALAAKITQISFYMVPVFTLIFGLIVAAILMAVFNFGFDAQVPFSRAMGIVFYSYLPGVIAGILAIISVALNSNPEGINVRNMVASNPAYFMDPATSSKFLYQFLSGIDIFAIWTICLIGIGFAVNSNNRKLSRGTAIGTVFALFIVWKLITSAIGFGA